MFGDLSPQDFLDRYWQQQPLLIRQGLPGFQDPVTPEELAGLACEEGAESRLVSAVSHGWRLRQGPFSESDFTALPDAGWTLLVQAVDHWFPPLKALLEPIAFIPAWRVDDIMVSYATAGGGVGPHFDYYDVFIIQGRGSRRWQLGRRCDAGSPLDTTSGLKILESFSALETFDLQAGDVLYIPPGYSHHGVALDDSLSYSVGFRAPSEAEVLAGFTATVCSGLDEDQRYRDPDLKPTGMPGEISPRVFDRLEALVRARLDDREALSIWFGRYMTQSKDPDNVYLPQEPLSPPALADALAKGLRLGRHPASRFAFCAGETGVILFADGEALPFRQPTPAVRRLIETLNAAGAYAPLDLDACSGCGQCLEALALLYNQGSLIEEDA